MEAVVDQRLQAIGIKRDEIFAKEALDLLIKMSGGLMREFIRLVQSAILHASAGKADKVELASAETAVDALRRDYMAGITDPLVKELITLTETGLPTGTDDGNMLLQNLYILCQSNKNLWYEVHPVLASFVQAEQVKRKGTGQGGPSSR